MIYEKKYFIIYIMNNSLDKLIQEVSQKNKENTEFLLENFFHRINTSKLLSREEKQTLLDYLIAKKYLVVNPNVAKNEKIILDIEDDINRFQERINYSLQNIKDLEDDYEQTTLERSKTRIDIKHRELTEKIYELNQKLKEEEKLENNDYYFSKTLIDNLAFKLGFKKDNTSKKMQSLIDSYVDKDFVLQNLKKYESYTNIIESLNNTCEEKKETINKKKEAIGESRKTLEDKKKVLSAAQEELELSKVADFQKVGKIFREHYRDLLTDTFIEQYEPIMKRLYSVEKLLNILQNSRNIENYLKSIEKSEKELALNEKSLKILLKDIEDPDYYISRNAGEDNRNKIEKLKVA